MTADPIDSPETLDESAGNKARPTITDRGQSRAAERAAAQAEALRANLARRKAQSRARKDDGGQG
ncbi:hypothetical protein [Insolitispirillum peregrinum]|uniref:Uncharacterized protein n=1 Tax=Insolitispirillum peregrinum TaxID=80876 RepID=A0A1N7P7J6_9PROT|nr:hypothetical protein [Insolitispirillum peregrinum]SIT06553.1 hypothetical protein SAMN05421779_106124 [Insolitispirillum peregrinum]